MAGRPDIGGLGPRNSAHLYRLALAALITILIVPTQPVESVEVSALAVGLGSLAALVHVVAFGGFTEPVSTAVGRREILLTLGAVAVGIVLVALLPANALVASIHGALGYVWTGSLAAATLGWRDDSEKEQAGG